MLHGGQRADAGRAAGSVDPELAALWDALRDDPDDLEAYLVLGDWLQERGDPRGQLIAIDCALADGQGTPELLERRRALFSAHQAQWLGPLAAAMVRDHLAITWYCGYIRRAAVRKKRGDRADMAHVVTALAHHPSAALLRELRLEWSEPGEAGFAPALDGLASAGARRSLYRLVIGERPAAERPGRPAHAVRADSALAADVVLDPVWEAAPALRELAVHGREVIASCAAEAGAAIPAGEPFAPMLRVFAVRTPRLARAQREAIVAAAWPALERLELWLGEQRTAWRQLLAELAGERFPKLARLGLCNTAGTDELAHALVRARVLPRLRALDLSGGTLTDAGARELLDHHAALAHLERIHLDHNFLSESVVGELRRCFGTEVVNPKHQRNPRREIVAPLFRWG